ncbi:MAG: heat-inducible transcriptional repressor HrcA [Bacillota bacterium]|jgi:heat-inducible transcriptional repressor|nr:heat-inducible transcription repressor HrcA [Bacillota bacterium]HOB90457.1 heat-inducible transcriptional repressor HrcA [Bacillota bacterium]HPZ53803.1 heat-inducible transcriptional repressor HrcA [Bacillota bacterium]HQD17312.1 heat-inducible transcriptional repressor HrcA [Bacillota bacterium]
MMDKRKQIILLAVTTDYIQTAEPVGSRSIVKHYRLGISPATARNEMADLEESGYLTQPHTSAGRIPSDKGYRFYVDVLMDAYRLKKSELRTIAERMERKRRDVENLIADVVRLLADMCESAAVVLGPVINRSRYKHISFAPMPRGKVMVILVATPGIVDSQIVDARQDLSQEDLNVIANFLNEKLEGRYLSDIDDATIAKLSSEVSRYTSLMNGTEEFLRASLQTSDDIKMYLDGASQVLVQPEFQDLERVRTLFECLERRDVVRSVLKKADSSGRITVTIGRENDIEGLKECSVIQAGYGYGGDITGSIAVIGPTRMNYARVMSIIEHVSQSLSSTLDRLYSG